MNRNLLKILEKYKVNDYDLTDSCSGCLLSNAVYSNLYKWSEHSFGGSPCYRHAKDLLYNLKLPLYITSKSEYIIDEVEKRYDDGEYFDCKRIGQVFDEIIKLFCPKEMEIE